MRGGLNPRELLHLPAVAYRAFAHRFVAHARRAASAQSSGRGGAELARATAPARSSMHILAVFDW